MKSKCTRTSHTRIHDALNLVCRAAGQRAVPACASGPPAAARRKPQPLTQRSGLPIATGSWGAPIAIHSGADVTDSSNSSRNRLVAAAVPPAAPSAGEASTGPRTPRTPTGSKSGPAAAAAAAAADGDGWQQEIVSALAQAEGFAELTIRAKVASAQPWHTITLRPVSLRGGRHLQVTTFTARQSTSVNHPVEGAEGPGAVEAVVRPLLQAAGLGSVTLRTAGQDLAVQITKRGKGIVHRSTPQSRPSLVSTDPVGRGLAHDRAKDTPIPSDQRHPFLQKIGFQTADGRIKANMQDKFSQVNEFLKLLGHTDLIRDLVAARQQQPQQQQQAQAQQQHHHHQTPQAPTAPPAPSPERPLQILDCGCGSSHLTFGTYHYLNHVLHLPARLGGVDVNAALMAKANEQARQLGLEGATFDVAPIGDYCPPVRPDIVLALHACDTATDDALALAVKQGSPLVLAVPCCHAHLHKQLAGRPPSSRPPWGPLLRHGILRQRQLDLLTDSLRAQLLRIAGYRTDVVEFVSTEHTPRNLLIRAVRQQQQQQPQQPPAAKSASSSSASSPAAAAAAAAAAAPCAPAWSRQQLEAAAEYLALRDYWQVLPRLEVLLQDELGPLLSAAAEASAAADPRTSRSPYDDETAGEEED